MAGVKVLLVDDEEDFIAALSARLETRGLTVDAVGNGEAAIQKASETQYDAIVLDLAMPGMDGIETLRALKERQADIHVILLTGQGSLKKGVEAILVAPKEAMIIPSQRPVAPILWAYRGSMGVIMPLPRMEENMARAIIGKTFLINYRNRGNSIELGAT